LFLFNSYNEVAEINIEEYVPTNTQKIIASINPLRDIGPKKNIAHNTKKSVSEVYKLLLIVPFTESSTIISKVLVFPQCNFKLYLILSKITIVSAIE
jgi:hypothetical protein